MPELAAKCEPPTPPGAQAAAFLIAETVRLNRRNPFAFNKNSISNRGFSPNASNQKIIAASSTRRRDDASKSFTDIIGMRKLINFAAVLAFSSLCGAPLLPAQSNDQGPMGPPPKFEVRRIPSTPHPGPPPIPEQEIIRRFAANEDAMKKAFDDYTYMETIRFQEMTDPGGMVTVMGDTYLRPNGERYLRVLKEPAPTLKFTKFSAQDVAAMAAIPYFLLTSDEIQSYNFVYAGQQQLDQLNTYAFQVKPKLLSRSKRLFEGVVWVDDHDFAIVKSFGKFELANEPEDNRLPFTMFETYRENFQEKYWLPTYTESDDEVKVPNQDPIPVHLIIHAIDFKLRDAAPATATPAPPSQTDQAQPISPPQ